MSARVINPIVINEFILRTPGKNFPCSKKINRIKKDLFGPTNNQIRREEFRRYFEKEMKKHQDIAARRWGFDFAKGCPLSGKGRFIWERVPINDFIPGMYTLSRAAHVREVAEYEVSPFDELLDERAAKHNEPSVRSFAHDRLFKAPSEEDLSYKSLGKRQPKITEYMKERKRLAPTPKKVLPVKRLKSNLHSTSSSSTTSSSSSSSTATTGGISGVIRGSLHRNN